MSFSKTVSATMGLVAVLVVTLSASSMAQGYGGAWNRGGPSNLPHFGRGINDALIRPVYPRGGFVTPPRRYVPRTSGPVPHRLGRFGNHVPPGFRRIYRGLDQGYRTMVPRPIQRDLRNLERRIRNERYRVTDRVNRQARRSWRDARRAPRRIGREARRVFKKIF